MTKAQNIKFLMDLGITEDRAKKMSIGIPESGVEEFSNTELEEVLISAVDHQRDLYTNSDDYKTNVKKIKNDTVGEIYKKAQKKIISLSSLTPEEVKDKDYEEIVDLAWTKMSKKGTVSEEELQKELNIVSLKLKTLEEEEIPKIRSEVDNEKKNFKIDNALLSMLTGLKVRKGSEAEDMILLIKTKATRAGYSIGLDEKGAIEIKNEDGSKINTEDKKAFMQPKDLITKFLDPFIEKSGAPDPEDKNKGKHKIDDDDDNEAGANGKAKQMTSYQKEAMNRAKDHLKNLAD